ncbi:DUF927 domain-containing protein [Lichenicoccus roseus]|uniref:DUF927 domain-containing protein n=1 Tax=Lichenicoccus roseus TaxID=2683649 RepID=A0A5R9J792_9PROT|nr:DUF927 domain-containing protein [Lichenicoccus roseus]TLU71226.1 DUF927 domain-containing protein [Lichenicoccus roseus]
MDDGMLIDPFAPLDLRDQGEALTSQATLAKWLPELPAPTEPPEAEMIRHQSHGYASARWIYRDGEGRPLFAVACFNKPDGHKEVLPYTYGTFIGRRGWHFKLPPAPMHLYGLDQLAARPSAPVLLVEGEKAADAAAALFPDHIAISWQGGAQAVAKADWLPLAGRAVTIWPDNDAPGADAATGAARLLRSNLAVQAHVVELPSGWPEGWDLADAPPPGVYTETLRAMLVTVARYIVAWPPGFSMRREGLFWQRDDPEKTDWWLAAPFVVEGEIRDSGGDGWGLLLSWRDRDGRLHRWSMEHRALIGESSAVEAELMHRGLSIATAPSHRAKLRMALAAVRSETRVTSVPRAGWQRGPSGLVYVMPDGEVVGETCERVILNAGAIETPDVAAVAGTVESWQAEVGAPAVGNDYLALFLAASFAGPLLDVTGDKSGGFHLFGRSQTGKTTLLRCAASVWGPPEMGAMLRSWRATANGLEATAAEASDALLPLDEIGQADGREVAEVVYLLGNESGKRRSNRDGSARRSKTWRLIFLSTGEMDLAAKLMEAGKRVMAGQDVRMVSMPLPRDGLVAGNLCGHADTQALLVHLNEAIKRNYGSPARAFIAALARARAEDAAGVVAALAATRSRFLAAHLPAGADGQVVSIARRFALAAAAGELAAGFGVLPWPNGEAERAAGSCFRQWLSRRGGAGAAEDTEALERVRHFIALHGSSRFATLVSMGMGVEEEADPHRTLSNRAGWRRKDSSGRWEYLIQSEVWAKEVCAGADPREVARALKACDLLLTEEGRLTSKQRIPGYDRPRVYRVAGGILDGREAEP